MLTFMTSMYRLDLESELPLSMLLWYREWNDLQNRHLQRNPIR